jgi:Tfp pilus assembly protein PilF
VRSRSIAIAALVVCATAAGILAHAAAVGAGHSSGVRIVSVPAGASVFVDGEFAGIAPVTLQADDPKPRSLRIEKAGYETFATRIEPGEHPGGEATYELEHLAHGSLVVISKPRGAEVFLDGRFQGITPLTLNDIPAGTRLVRVEKSNHSHWAGSVDIGNGEQQVIECKLKNRVLEFLKRAVAEKPDDILRYVELGHYYMVVSEPELAAETYRAGRELAQNPEVSRDHRNRLEKQIRKDMMARGRDGERFRIAIQPTRSTVRTVLTPEEALEQAAQQRKAGHLKEAADILETSLRRNPTHTGIALEHARLRIISGDRVKTPSALSEVFRRTGAQLEPRIELAELCLEHAKKFDDIRRRTILGLCATQLATARGRNRAGGEDAAVLLSRLYLQSNRGGQAIPLLRDAIKMADDDEAKKRLRLQLGLVLTDVKRFDDAREELEAAVTSDDVNTRTRAREALSKLPPPDSR